MHFIYVHIFPGSHSIYVPNLHVWIMIQQGRLSSQFHKLPQLSGCPALWNSMHLDRSLIDHLIDEWISNLTINKDVQSVKAHVATVTL